MSLERQIDPLWLLSDPSVLCGAHDNFGLTYLCLGREYRPGDIVEISTFLNKEAERVATSGAVRVRQRWRVLRMVTSDEILTLVGGMDAGTTLRDGHWYEVLGD